MAKAEITYTCKVCGKQAKASAIKCNRAEAERWQEWAKDAYDLCPECYAKAAKEEHEARVQTDMEAFSSATTVELAQLTGTPKQIAWAESIRRDRISELVRNYPNVDKDRVATVLNHKTSASWWIDNRHHDIRVMTWIIRKEIGEIGE